MAHKKQDSNWVDDNGKVKVTDNDVRHPNVDQRYIIDWMAQVFLDFCGDTTMHGLGQATFHTVSIVKLAWIVAFLGAQGGLFYYISNLIKIYMDRPIQETTTILHKPTRFPDVTVCNLDPISISNLEAMLNIENSSISKYNARINQMYEDGVIPSSQLFTLRSHINILSNIDADETVAVGHQLKDFILRCTFLGQPCNWTKQ